MGYRVEMVKVKPVKDMTQAELIAEALKLKERSHDRIRRKWEKKYGKTMTSKLLGPKKSSGGSRRASRKTRRVKRN